MSPRPLLHAVRSALLPLLALWPLLPAQAQTAPASQASSPRDVPPAHCGTLPHPPRPPRLTEQQRERHLQKALGLNADQAHQLDALLSQAHEQHQPPDEARLARLLNAEQLKRLHELQPPPPPEPPAPPPLPEAPACQGCDKPTRSAPPARPAG
ncbi:hypothetical protein [Pelomonas sp. BJYL3]|uniref:hypothetical protein n=1 Tax=Pelomonas sp. BJYL3 TaxID=2976697 RepID=UPI0022B4567B|nr:hypothetical protein [Pelomonas sp. BJYL3]